MDLYLFAGKDLKPRIYNFIKKFAPGQLYILYSNLLYKMGNYYLDILYSVLGVTSAGKFLRFSWFCLVFGQSRMDQIFF